MVAKDAKNHGTRWVYWLVVGTMAFMTFHSLGNFIIPTVTHSIIFLRGRSTTNQTRWVYEISLALGYCLSTNYVDSTKKHRGFHGDFSTASGAECLGDLIRPLQWLGDAEGGKHQRAMGWNSLGDLKAMYRDTL